MAEGVIGVVDVSGGGLGERERVLGQGGVAGLVGEKHACLAGVAERVFAGAEGGERFRLFGAHEAELAAVGGLLAQPLGPLEGAEGLP